MRALGHHYCRWQCGWCGGSGVRPRPCGLGWGAEGHDLMGREGRGEVVLAKSTLAGRE